MEGKRIGLYIKPEMPKEPPYPVTEKICDLTEHTFTFDGLYTIERERTVQMEYYMRRRNTLYFKSVIDPTIKFIATHDEQQLPKELKYGTKVNCNFRL